MNLARISLWPYVLISFIFILLLPSFTLFLKINLLIPCIIISIYQKPLNRCLWISFSLGLFLDLLSAHIFGLNVIAFCLVCTMIYKLKKHFFADSLTTLPILTFLASGLVACTQILIVYALDREVNFNFIWLTSNIILLPMLDAVYAFCLFQIPFILFGKRKRREYDYFNSLEA